MKDLPVDPIFTGDEALAFETDYVNGDEELEWKAMNQAG